MIKVALSIFLIIHGLVHLLYLGQSRGLFELQPGMSWPDGSWAFSRLFADGSMRLLASTALILAAIGFVASGVGLLAGQSLWRQVAAGSAFFSVLIYLFFWDGGLANLADKGAVGILINLALLAAFFLFDWPVFQF